MNFNIFITRYFNTKINHFIPIKKQIILLFVFFLPVTGFSQSEYDFLKFQSNNDNQDTNQLSLTIRNLNFLKNNEYFGNFTEGYTLIGYYVQPRILYQINHRIKLETGIHLLQYSGLQKYSQIYPLFCFTLKLNDRLTTEFGNISGTLNHNLTDPVFAFERHLTNPVENGIQFLYENKWMNSALWINWENFIFSGSTEQEKFTLGFTNTATILPLAGNKKLFFNFNLIATHRGGQINKSEEHLQSIINTSTGIKYSSQPDYRFFKDIEISSDLVTYSDLSPDKQLPYIYGYGIYSRILTKTKHFNFSLDHWYGKFFVNTRGEPMFRNISARYEGYKEPKRAMVVGKAYWITTPYRFIKFGVGAETYYDLYNGTFEYSYSFYLKSELNFKIYNFSK